MTAGPRAGLGLTTRCLGLASDTSISSAPELSPGEPDRKSIVSSSCLLSPSATVWMAVVHSSLWEAQVRPPALPGARGLPGAAPTLLPLLGSLHVERALDDCGPLQAADNEGVGPRPLRLHQLAF